MTTALINTNDHFEVPAVDDGTIYPDILKYIVDNEFTIKIEDQMSMTMLQSLVPNHIFVKIADGALNTEQNFPGKRRQYITEGPDFSGKLVDYLVVEPLKHKWAEVEKEWIYTIVYDGHVVKIGMTSSGLKSRYSSYGAGSKKAMKKGSAATTGFVVMQSNYLALLKQIKVEIFAYEIPSIWTNQNIFGREVPVLNKVAHKYETVLIDLFKSTCGSVPFLCGQS